MLGLGYKEFFYYPHEEDAEIIVDLITSLRRMNIVYSVSASMFFTIDESFTGVVLYHE